MAFTLAAEGQASGKWNCSFVFFGIEPVLVDYENFCRSRKFSYCHVRTRRGQAWQSWSALYRSLRSLRPEAIILHSVKAILPCVAYARLHGVPLIAVEHQPNSLKSTSEWWVSKLLRRMADAVILLSSDYRKELELQLGHGKLDRKYQIIPNGIDIEFFSRRSTGAFSSESMLIGMAARFSVTKRQELLVEAVARLREEDSGCVWRLTLAGDGETHDCVRDRAQSLGVEDLVEFTGTLTTEELQLWFQKIDIYAHASDGETLSTSLLQAMAMGLPIVGSDVAGIENLLGLGQEAGVVVAQDSSHFAAAFRALAVDEERARRLGARARAMAVEQFSQAGMFRKYESVIASLCRA